MFRTFLKSAARQLHDLSIKTIKPASPTPSPLRRYNLSPIDQFSPPIYMPIVFYYPNRVSNSLQDIADKSCRLKHSLSEILTHYYPFAGRLNSGAYVDCNDEGVDFQEVHIKCRLSQVLEKSEDETVDIVFPAGLAWGRMTNGSSLLVVRLTNFECGGLSIAVCLSHTLADAQTFSSFMTFWATKMRTDSSSEGARLFPHFMSFPVNEDVFVSQFPDVKKYWVTRRFEFPNSKLAQLKTVVDELGLQNTTRVEVLTALLYKCAMAATTTNSGFFTPSVLFHPVNMRPKILPPLPETSMGNFYWSLTIPTTKENENNFNALVEKIKKEKKEIRGMKSLDTINTPLQLEFARNNYNIFMCSSLCKMQFYQVDFGWGYPSRVTLGGVPMNNGFILMDAPNGDGIVALASLEEKNMVTFEHDKEILAYTSSCLVSKPP
ncbi:hypothetical protein LguiA_025741 [Lonicera macranthoides]